MEIRVKPGETVTVIGVAESGKTAIQEATEAVAELAPVLEQIFKPAPAPEVAATPAKSKGGRPRKSRAAAPVVDPRQAEIPAASDPAPF